MGNFYHNLFIIKWNNHLLTYKWNKWKQIPVIKQKCLWEKNRWIVVNNFHLTNSINGLRNSLEIKFKRSDLLVTRTNQMCSESVQSSLHPHILFLYDLFLILSSHFLPVLPEWPPSRMVLHQYFVCNSCLPYWAF